MMMARVFLKLAIHVYDFLATLATYNWGERERAPTLLMFTSST